MSNRYGILRYACVAMVIAASALFTADALAQTSKDFAVALRADITTTPRPRITLRWAPDSMARSYSVWRKIRGDVDWPQAPVAELEPTADQYADVDVVIGEAYEYQVLKDCIRRVTDSTQLHYVGVGYIYAGIERAPDELPGRVLVLVDSTMMAPLQTELTVLENDLKAEGWQVVRRAAPRAERFDSGKVQRTKAIVLQEYAAAPLMLRSVLLIGRVPVPYSGRMNPDGHGDHVGAWPADMYYGDIDGRWTDIQIRDTSASRPANRNVPGDGKFDQSQVPGAIDLAVGRVDFYDMPAFTDSETELLRKYLNKNHAFRSGALKPDLAAVIDDNFSAASYPEAFASAGWRNFPVFGGDTSVMAGDYFGELGKSRTYLWAYGCGGGTYTSAGGVGNSTDFTTKKANAVFTLLFGSYFGDWDSQNNFLRASIASSPASLTCAWVARPQWYFHHMALGETIGRSTVLSQNNQSSYIPNVYYTPQYPNGVIYAVAFRFTHAALMGDPTLRAQMAPVTTPGAVVTEVDSSGRRPVVNIRWGAPSGRFDGFFVYRATDRDSVYRLLNRRPVSGLSFVDSTATDDVADYIVRAAVLNRTASGSYYSAGAGVSGSARLATVGSAVPAIAERMNAAPNPAVRSTLISFALPGSARARLEAYDVNGKVVRRFGSRVWSAGSNAVTWDLRDDRGRRVPSGLYFVKLIGPSSTTTTKLVVTE